VKPRTYRVEIDGELDARYAAAFDGMTVTTHAGATVLEGVIEDQAQLQGLILKVSVLGLTLLSLEAERDQTS
jgi:hypothetical protein